MIPGAVAEIVGSDPATGQSSGIVTQARLLGSLRRTMGLAGDVVEVAVKRADWPPALTDMTGEGVWLVRAGDDDDTIVLDGFNLLGAEPLSYGRGFPVGVEVEAQELKLTLATAPYRLRDGRGGTLRIADHGGALNPLNADGVVDEEHDAYRTNRELTQLCLDAIGWAAFLPLPATLDLTPPPGPLDWGNARALPELESLLARAGHGISFYSEQQGVAIFKLPRAGDAVTVPGLIQASAEPFELTPAPGARARRVIVTSGQTRTMILATREMNDLEFVAFDERTGRWLNESEWTGLYEDEPGPADIERFRMGPGKSPDERRQFARLFTALRLKPDDASNGAPILTIRKEVVSPGGIKIGGAPATALAQYAQELAPGQYRNSATPPAAGSVIEGVRVEAAERVFIFPDPLVRMATAAGEGAAGDAEQSTSLKLIFAHEARTGRYADDFFVAAFRIDQSGAVERVEDEAERDEVIDDRYTLHVAAPFLQRVARAEDEDLVFLNEDELDAVALALAEIRVQDAGALAGVVPVRGLIDGLPGDWGGAVTSVEWDLPNRRTYFYVNEHEAPGSVIEARENAARRSIAAGLSRFSLPGSSAAMSDVRAGFTPAVNGGPARGAEKLGELRTMASPAAPTRVRRQRLLARITAATPITANRWTYSWEEEVVRDDMSASPGGSPRTQADLGAAVNLAELHNSAAGVQGNGVDIDNLPEGWTLRPIATGCVVVLEGPVGAPDEEFMLFHAINAVDGECAPESEASAAVADGSSVGYSGGADELLALSMSGRGL